MKIAVLTRYFFPQEGGRTIKRGQGADIRVYELYWRIAENAKVVIVTQKFTAGEAFSLENLIFSKEEFEGIEVRRVPCGAPFFILTRLPSPFRLWEVIKAARGSGVIVAEFHPFHAVGLEALIAKWLTGKPLVLDVHDIASGGGGICSSIYLAYERFAAKNADGIIATSREMEGYFRKQGIGCPVAVVENGVDTKGRFYVPGCKKKLGLEGKVVVGLLGSLTPQHGAEYLIRAFPQILRKFPNAVLLLIGGGREKEKLEMLAKERGVQEKVIFTGLVPYEKVNEYLSACDVLAAPFPKGREYTTNLPLKLPEYLAIGKPIVVTNGPVLSRIATESGAGEVAEAESPESIAKAVTRALDNPEMGKGGRDYAEKRLEWRALVSRMGKFLRGFA